MTYKNLLLHMEPGDAAAGRLNIACGLAERLGAVLIGVDAAMLQVPVIDPTGFAAVDADLISSERQAFEAEFAAYVGAKHCIGVGNGLDALTMSLLAMGVNPGDEVLVPSNTFIATWLGATHARAVPRPMEPDFATHVVTPEAYAPFITSKTRVLLPVHLYGLPVDIPGFQKLAKERGVLLLEDAAQAHGATVNGTRVGGFGTTATCRASFGMYNTLAEVDRLADALQKARGFFS